MKKKEVISSEISKMFTISESKAPSSVMYEAASSFKTSAILTISVFLY
jgi:hypothetical protein